MARMMWLAWLSCLHGAPNLRSDARGIRCFMVSQACTILPGRNRCKLLLILARKASETRRITFACTQRSMPDECYQWVEDATVIFHSHPRSTAIFSHHLSAARSQPLPDAVHPRFMLGLHQHRAQAGHQSGNFCRAFLKINFSSRLK